MIKDRKQILDQADKLTGSDRAIEHGMWHLNAHYVASMWSAYLGYKVDAEEVGPMLILLKLARTRSLKPNPDNYVDMAGYAALAGELVLDPQDETVPEADTGPAAKLKKRKEPVTLKAVDNGGSDK